MQQGKSRRGRRHAGDECFGLIVEEFDVAEAGPPTNESESECERRAREGERGAFFLRRSITAGTLGEQARTFSTPRGGRRLVLVAKQELGLNAR